MKEVNKVKTNNIYISWMEAIGESCAGEWEPRELNDFNFEELHHLKWLIEEEIKTRNDADNSNCEE